MGSTTNSLSGLFYLTQPGGLLPIMPASISTAGPQSASAHDVVSLSETARQTQEVDGKSGTSQASQNPLPIVSAPTNRAADVLPGSSAADTTNATPQAQASINDQALRLQQVQGLFALPLSLTASTNLLS
jgi:hypothetical protein